MVIMHVGRTTVLAFKAVLQLYFDYKTALRCRNSCALYMHVTMTSQLIPGTTCSQALHQRKAAC